MSTTHKGVYLAVIFVWMSLVESIAQPQLANLRWQFADYGVNLGANGLHLADLDGDGKDEMICGSNPSNSYSTQNSRVLILKYKHGTYDVDWTSPSATVSKIMLADRDRNTHPELFILTSSGMLQQYDGRSYAHLGAWQLPVQEPVTAEISDLDSDGKLDIIVSFASAQGGYRQHYIKVFDLYTFALKWDTVGVGGQEVAVGNFDDDRNLEFAVSDPVTKKGLVFDGKTKAVQWVYEGGFGERLMAADIDNNGRAELLAFYWRQFYYDIIFAYDVSAQHVLWEIETNTYVNAIHAVDLDHDGKMEILAGRDQWAEVFCYDGATRQLEWSRSQIGYDLSRLVSGDSDGDGEIEICAATKANHDAYLSLINSLGSQLVWQNARRLQPFSIALAPTAAEGKRFDLLVGAQWKDNYNVDAGRILRYDGESHLMLWKSEPLPWPDELWSLNFARFGPPDSSRYVAGLRYGFYVFDAPSGKVSWWQQSLGGVPVLTFTADTDGDGSDEILAAPFTGSLEIYDGRGRQLSWTIPTVGKKVDGVVVANFDRDPAREILFYTNNSIAQIFDAETHLLEWQSQDVLNVQAIAGGSLSGDSAPEILLGTADGRVHIFDGATKTRLWQRQFSDAPIHALAVAYVDGAPRPELVALDTALKIYDYSGEQLLWQSQSIGFLPYANSSLICADVDRDEYMDILVATENGVYHFEGSQKYNLSTVVAMETAAARPETYTLYQNFPNPFWSGATSRSVADAAPRGAGNPVTHIRYYLPAAGPIKLNVYNLRGEKVAALTAGTQAAGFHDVEFTGTGLASGIYFYKLEAASTTLIKKMIIAK